jgi:hypothetical protein
MYPTDLLDGQATGSCPDGFLYKERPHFTLFELVLPGDIYGNGTDPRLYSSISTISRKDGAAVRSE